MAQSKRFQVMKLKTFWEMPGFRSTFWHCECLRRAIGSFLLLHVVIRATIDCWRVHVWIQGLYQMSEDLLLKAERRSKLGSVDTKRLRASGRVPANIYGLGQPAESVSVCGEAVEKLVATRSSVVDVEVDGKVNKAVVQELQWDVFSTVVQHVDLRRVDPNGRATVDVALEFRGDPVGLKDGGVIRQLHKKVSINCPIFESRSRLRCVLWSAGWDSVKAGDLQLPEYATLVTAASEVLIELYDPRKV